MISTSLSITESIDSNCFAAAIINFPRQSVAKALFSMDGKPVDSANRYEDIWDFMKKELSDPDTTQVIIAVPTGLWVLRPEYIPVLALEANSIYLKILHYLSETKYCAFLTQSLFLVGLDETIEVALVTPSSIKPAEFMKSADTLARLQQELHQDYIGQDVLLLEPLREGSEDPPPHKLMIIYPTVANAYAHFLFGNCLSLSWAAVAAGLIARNDSLYYYFASQGIVQSSQDIVAHFRQTERGGHDLGQRGFLYSYPGPDTAVGSAQEIYTIKIGNYSRFHNVDQIPLKYAVAMRKYQESSRVNEANAQKFALLTVCKLWGIRLYCERFQFEYLFRSHQNREEQLIFDPQQSTDPWITDILS